jgi:hypothetical protein
MYKVRIGYGCNTSIYINNPHATDVFLREQEYKMFKKKSSPIV